MIPPLVSHTQPAPIPDSLLLGLSATQVEAIATVVIACLTLAYVLVASRQLHAMRGALKETQRSNEATEESNRIAKRSLELGRRAWLVASEINAPTVFIPDQPWTVRMSVENCGGVPATSVISQVHCLVIPADSPLPDELQLTAIPPTGIAIVAPGHPRSLTTDLPGLQSDDVEAFKSGAVTLYIYCRLHYKDVLIDSPERRQASACWRLLRAPDRWAIAEKHNTAD
jgi:hypothetical protein